MDKTELNQILNKTPDGQIFPPEGIRLNKFLSDAGFCSRREADRRIEAGEIFLDGRKAVLGDRVMEGQKVTAGGKEITLGSGLILLLLNKPAGIECTSDRTNPANIIDFVNYPQRVYPIGRLDKNSTGLILLTNAGELVNRILRSANYHEKEYLVETDKEITEEFLKQMRKGVTIYIDNEDRTVTTRRCSAEKTGKRSFRIILTQGYNRQIRRMCRALGYQVTSLKRIRIMNLLLKDIPEGTYRGITDEELNELLKQL